MTWIMITAQKLIGVIDLQSGVHFAPKALCWERALMGSTERSRNRSLDDHAPWVYWLEPFLILKWIIIHKGENAEERENNIFKTIQHLARRFIDWHMLFYEKKY